MATLAELHDALVNADKAGDAASARQLADAIHGMKYTAGPTPSASPNATPITRTEKVTQGLVDPFNGGAQLLTKMLPESWVKAGDNFNNMLADKTGLVARLPEGGVDQQVREGEKAYQAKRAAAGESGFDGYRMLGNVASPANLAVAAAAPVRGGLLARTLAGSGAGAATSALAPVTEGDSFLADKLKQTGIGAAGGAIVPAVVSGVSRVVSPKASTNADLTLLKSEGVKPTIGQLLGGRWNAAEEKLQSLPLMGDAIANARGKTVEQFNTAAINRATAPVGVKVEGAGQKAIAEAGDAVSAAYNAGKAALGNFKLDQQGVSELKNLQQLTQSLPPKEQAAFNSTWQYLGGELSPNGSLLADGFKRLDSKIGAEVAKFSGSTDAYQKQAGEALKELQRILTENAKRANPRAADMLNKADEAWANLVRIEGAGVSAKGNNGVFTPGQLGMAARAADTSVRDRATARGTALMQDLSNAGQNVIGNKVPNSFTADRAMLGAGAAGSYFLNPAIPAALVGGAAAYTPPVQSLLRMLISSRPDAAKSIAEALNKSSPALASGGGLLGLQLLP